MKKVVIAIDSFKGCLSSAEAGKAAAEKSGGLSGGAGGQQDAGAE